MLREKMIDTTTLLITIVVAIVIIAVIWSCLKNEAAVQAKKLVSAVVNKELVPHSINSEDIEKVFDRVCIIGVPEREDYQRDDEDFAPGSIGEYGFAMPAYSNYAFPNANLWPPQNYPSSMYTAMRQFTPGFRTNGLQWFYRPNFHVREGRGRWHVNNGSYYYIYP